MALDTNEKVYQSDMQHITPVADAAIYGTFGDWILRGLDMTVGASSVTLQAGQALLQGRLYELTSDKVISTAGLTQPYYVGLQADLSQTNTATSNEQYTMVASQTGANGDLRAGDIQAFIPIYSVTSAGVTKTVVQYTSTYRFESAFGGNGTVKRVGKFVSFRCNFHSTSAIPANSIFARVPIEYAPFEDLLVIINEYYINFYKQGGQLVLASPNKQIQAGAYLTSSGAWLTL